MGAVPGRCGNLRESQMWGAGWGNEGDGGLDQGRGCQVKVGEWGAKDSQAGGGGPKEGP